MARCWWKNILPEGNSQYWLPLIPTDKAVRFSARWNICFPKGKEFKTYSLKTSELHPDCNFPCTDEVLDKKLRHAAEKIFKGVKWVGYARLDFRVNDKNEIYFLEINFTCSVFYTDGMKARPILF